MAVELASCFARLAGLVPLAATAARTALEIDHPVYDCFYLALAELESTQLVTADARLVAKTRGTRRAQQVVMLDVS
jgi:predicted nucleic acid-binding protein